MFPKKIIDNSLASDVFIEINTYTDIDTSTNFDNVISIDTDNNIYILTIQSQLFYPFPVP